MLDKLPKSYIEDLNKLSELPLSTNLFKRLKDAEEENKFDSINWRERNNDLVMISRLLKPGLR